MDELEYQVMIMPPNEKLFILVSIFLLFFVIIAAAAVSVYIEDKMKERIKKKKGEE